MSKHPVQKARDTSRRGFDHDRKHYDRIYRGDWPASIEDFQAWVLNKLHVHDISFFMLLSSENAAPLKKRRWLSKPTRSFEETIMIIILRLLGEAKTTLSGKMFSFVREKIGPCTIKSDASAQIGDVNSEPAKYCDLKMDTWRPESALYR
ncbi:hypothetical protein ARMGADRAFT_1060103 [Armillaria gallica]|uniref:Uncharacterized protein n=1 Tax=Armillaria gallica TaxID=47427 RepID=A0A2H3E3B8_ARMGA|nr:hypothetical protein ARMGADRAFT_1060103 [Armillaria gallica]